VSDTTTVTVIGMTCDHCVRAVTEELSKLDGVTGVDVDLASGQVRVEAERPLDQAALASAIDEAGYELSG
jgi:copper ion binding protein